MNKRATARTGQLKRARDLLLRVIDGSLTLRSENQQEIFAAGRFVIVLKYFGGENRGFIGLFRSGIGDRVDWAVV